MKLAISAVEPSLDASVDPRFGRCKYFIIADPETMAFEAIENTSVMAAGGAGISTAQMISGKGAQLVLTGNCGPNAYQTLSAAGVQIITGVSGKVRDAIESYKTGQFQLTSQPNVTAHSGMSKGMRGMATGNDTLSSPISQPVSREQEVETIKLQSQMLEQQISGIQRRIEELERKSK